jgi:hypothetical protein
LSGECPGVGFTAAAIYYTWTDTTTTANTDTFMATWSGDGYTEAETFVLKLNSQYTLKVTADGSTLAAGKCAHISGDNPPAMPKLVAQLKATSGKALSGKVQWNLTVNYKGPDSPPTNYSFSKSGPLTATQAWTIPFGSVFIGGDPAFGGGATIKATYDGTTNSLSFCIDGTNPGFDDAKDEIGPSPWYFFQIAEEESIGTLDQFKLTKNGNERDPLWSNNHGFGIMQIDPPRKQADLFSWTQNIADGKSVLSGKSTAAGSFWSRPATGGGSGGQVQQYNAFRADNPSLGKKYPPPANKTVGSGSGKCTFGWNSNDSFADALSIQAYNGNGASGAYYLAWHNPITNPDKPGWAYNITTNTCRPNGYVSCVCSEAAY